MRSTSTSVPASVLSASTLEACYLYALGVECWDGASDRAKPLVRDANRVDHATADCRVRKVHAPLPDYRSS